MSKQLGRPIKGIPFKDKHKVVVFLTPKKETELKIKALKAGLSLSDFLAYAGSVTVPIMKPTTHLDDLAVR